MPKLTRLRIVSVGHPNARFDDLTLDFRDADGRPTDSTLWLRNGGGKSSILNLFFAGVRPHRREFLGASAETKRELHEYVLPNDHSVVAYEWELDGQRGQLAFDDDADRLITGSFYEWRGSDLKRYYFACRVTPDEPRLTLDNLPIYRQEREKRLARLTVTSFKQEWQSLQKDFPSRDVLITENHGEWQGVLERAGIDPELFRYQVIMNHREGGADELFRFDSHEDFVDFLLELVLDPTLGDTVRANLEKHRDDLRRSNHRLRPERELLQGLLDHLRPMTEVASARKQLRLTATACHQQLATLSVQVRDRCAALELAAQQFASDFERERSHAEEHDAAARLHRKFAATLRLFVAEQKQQLAEREHEASQIRREQASRQAKIWQAAIPLKNALRFERIAAEHRGSLQLRRQEQQPLLETLADVAERYAQALQFQIDVLRKQETNAVEQSKQLQTQVRGLRNNAAKCGEHLAKHATQIAHLQAQLDADRRKRQRLVDEGILLQDESGISATERLRSRLMAERLSERALEANIQSQRSLKESLTAQQHTAALDAVSAAASLRDANTIYQEALALRDELELDDLLCGTLEVERANLDQLNDTTIGLVRQRAGSVMQRLVALRVSTQEDQRAVHHLNDGGLLPPTRDVERLLSVFGDRIRAWSGWLYLAENSIHPRAAVQAVPQLAMGIVVSAGDFDAACEIAQATNIEYEMPLVLASEHAVSTNGLAHCMVLGPHSDAWFDRSAGQKELLRRDARLDATGRQITEAENEHKLSVELDSRLRAFRHAYPHGWFARQQAEIERCVELTAEKEELVAELRQKIGDAAGKIDEAGQQVAAVRDAVRLSERQLQQVEQYCEQFESKTAQWRSEVEAAQRDSLEKQAEQKRDTQQADELEEQAAAVQEELRLKRRELAQDELLFNQIEYRSKTARVPQLGPVQQLRDDYLRQKSQYELNVGEEGLLQLARENDENAQRERQKFEEHLGELVVEQDVLNALRQLDDPEQAERMHEEARQAMFVALSALGNLKQALNQAGEKRDEALRRCGELGASLQLPDEEQPADIQTAEQNASSAEQSTLEHEEFAQRSLVNAAQASTARDAADADAKIVRGFSDQLKSMERNHLELLQRLTAGFVASPPEELAAGVELRTVLQELDETLMNLKQQDLQLSTRRQLITKHVRQWVSDQRFDQLQSQIIRQCRGCEESQFEEQIDPFLEQLSLRLKTIEEKLAEISENRNQLVSELHAIADDGYSVLRSAANQSRLPESVPGLAGSQFLTINLNWPDDPAELRVRLAELIDDLVDADKMPSGLELIQSAVRRLARPVRARVLNPDPNHQGQRLEIPELSKFSGGERLTCAVLLYCTLAQLRAKRRGLHHKPSGVLLLDNPIGSASRVTFINLQLDVARAMGIQLIYTTGVNDYEAIRPLPNSIRLKNDRVNRNNGHHLVELDNSDPVIEAVRIARIESPNGAKAESEEMHAR